MKRIRFYNVIGLLTNLAIIALAVLSYIAVGKVSANNYARYDIVASFVAIAAALLMGFANIVSIVKGETRIPPLFTGIYFIAATMSLVALITNICFPTYNGFKDIAQLFSIEGGYLFFSFLIPVVCVFNFLFIAIDKKIRFGSVFAPVIGTLLYVGGVIGAAAATKNAGLLIHSFLRLIPDVLQKEEKVTDNVITLLLFILITFGFALVMWMINRINHRIIFGSSIEEFESDTKGKKGEKKGFVNYLKDSVAFKTTVQNKPGTTYHISYHNRKLKTWKVKGEEYQKALKVFKTQKEAIDYAKALVKKNGGSIRVHSMVGKIRRD